jgi:hypothetical protein
VSSRFGRNKRRAARERIATLESDLAIANSRLARTERMLSTAREDGATALLRAKYLDEETRRITHLLADKYGPELMKAASRLVEATRERPYRPIDFRAVLSPNEMIETTVIEGFIPSLHYRVQVAHFP